ncbi:MAG: hypothetical protein EOM14_14725, partial [Clostridia bacterium]|nr:hypothetical protein [Clostridia bacterium]
MESLRNNQIAITPYAISSRYSGVKYAGICQILSDGADDGTEPSFVGGIGRVEQVGNAVTGLYPGDFAVFCGHSQHISAGHIVTAAANTVKVYGEPLAEYALCGYTAHVIHVAGKLGVELGLDVLVHAGKDDCGLISAILEKTGCHTHYPEDDLCLPDDRLADAAVIFSGSLAENVSQTFAKLKPTAPVVALTAAAVNAHTVTVCSDVGDDYSNIGVFADGLPFPEPYVPMTTKKNLQTALNIMYSGCLHKFSDDPSITVLKPFPVCENAVPVQEITDTDSGCFSEIRRLYREHINPGVLSILAFGKSEKETLHNILSTASYILNSAVKSCAATRSGKNVNINISCNDGSAAQCTFIYSARKTAWSAKLHFDGTSILLRDHTLEVFSGDIRNTQKAECIT